MEDATTKHIEELLAQVITPDGNMLANTTALVTETQSILSGLFGPDSIEVKEFSRSIQSVEMKRPFATSVLNRKLAITRGVLQATKSRVAKGRPTSTPEKVWIKAGPQATGLRIERSTFVGPRQIVSTEAKDTRLTKVEAHESEPATPTASDKEDWYNSNVVKVIFVLAAIAAIVAVVPIWWPAHD